MLVLTQNQSGQYLHYHSLSIGMHLSPDPAITSHLNYKTA